MKVIAVISMMLSGSIFAASFDCSQRLTPIEERICINDEISALDSKMSEIYKIKSNPHVRASQRVWIKDVRNKAKNDAALISAYKKRIAELRGIDATGFNIGNEKTNKSLPSINDSNVLTQWCSDKNSPFLNDMRQNASLYKFNGDEQREMFNKLRSKMVNSCVDYLLVNSVDGSKIPSSVDYDVVSHNEKAIDTWFSSYKDTLHKDLKYIQDLPKLRSAISKEQPQREISNQETQDATQRKQEQVNHGTAQQRINALSACETDGEVQGYINNKRELDGYYKRETAAMYHELVSSGYSSRDALRIVAETYKPLMDEVNRAVGLSNKAIRDCAQQRYGITLY